MTEDDHHGPNGAAEKKTGKILHFPSLKDRDRHRREQKEAEKAAAITPGVREPLVNLPLATKILLGVFILIHVVVHLLLSPEQRGWVFLNLGFVPGIFTGARPFEFLALATPLTHMFFHGNWIHLAMNGVMMMAFGSGIERWMGPRRMVVFFLLCGLFGALAHFALNPFSLYPVIGASGGLSGLFAAALIMINRGHGEVGGRFGILPFVILWIGMSVAFGMFAAPGGGTVAWAAHVGGFLGGFAALKLMRI